MSRPSPNLVLSMVILVCSCRILKSVLWKFETDNVISSFTSDKRSDARNVSVCLFQVISRIKNCKRMPKSEYVLLTKPNREDLITVSNSRRLK